MSSRCVSLLVLLLLALPAFSAGPLKVCADPQQLPLSNRQGQGYENKIAELLANELHTNVAFEWTRPSRGFVREVMNTGRCDVLIEVPVGIHGVLVTRPYYRSTYVFVTRAGEPPIHSFDDPTLRKKKIGVQALEEDYAPPATALARRKLSANVVPFTMDDPGQIVAAVAQSKIDTAVVWGPLAGYYAAKYGRQLRLAPVEPAIDPPMLPFAYEMAVGVRKGAPDLYARVNDVLLKRAADIRAILHEYHVPLLPLEQGGASAAGE